MIGNVLRDYYYQFVGMVGALFNPAVGDPLSGNAQPRLYVDKNDKRLHYVDANQVNGVLTTSANDGARQPVRAVTTAALPTCTYAALALTASANGALGAQDGVTLAVGDRLLVCNQATGAQNGIYVVTALGDTNTPWVLTRAADSNDSAEFVPGMNVPVGPEGALFGKLSFVLQTSGAITLDTTALTFGPPAPRVATVAFSATPAFSAAPFQHIKLTNNISSWTLAAGVHGQEVTIYFEQDATGSRTLSGTPSNVRLAGGALTLTTTASKVDALTFAWNEALGTPKWVEICRALNS